MNYSVHQSWWRHKANSAFNARLSGRVTIVWQQSLIKSVCICYSACRSGSHSVRPFQPPDNAQICWTCQHDFGAEKVPQSSHVLVCPMRISTNHTRWTQLRWAISSVVAATKASNWQYSNFTHRFGWTTSKKGGCSIKSKSADRPPFESDCGPLNLNRKSISHPNCLSLYKHQHWAINVDLVVAANYLTAVTVLWCCIRCCQMELSSLVLFFAFSFAVE